MGMLVHALREKGNEFDSYGNNGCTSFEATKLSVCT